MIAKRIITRLGARGVELSGQSDSAVIGSSSLAGSENAKMLPQRDRQLFCEAAYGNGIAVHRAFDDVAIDDAHMKLSVSGETALIYVYTADCHVTVVK